MTMAGLERLRFLIWWANAAGLLPFRMELDANTAKFRRFAFSWKHPLTWWLAVALVLRTAVSVSMRTAESSDDPAAMTTVAKVTVFALKVNYQADAFIFSVVPLMILLRWRNLAAAVKYVHKFDRMTAASAGHRPCRTKRRIAVGLVLIAAVVRCHRTSRTLPGPFKVLHVLARRRWPSRWRAPSGRDTSATWSAPS